MSVYHVTPADKDAFDQLLETLELKAPYGGYLDSKDLPRLKEADIATVLRAHPGLLDDFVVEHRDVADILDDKTILGGMTLSEYLHGALMAYTVKEARKVVFDALQDREDASEFEAIIGEREPDGECFRGGESAAYLAEQQAKIQRTLK